MGSPRVPEGERSQGLRWYYANRERLQAKRHAYYLRNKDVFARRAKDWKEKNPDAAKQMALRYAAKTPARSRHSHWRRQGIDVAAAAALVAAHDGRCGICGTTAPGGNKGWHLDHDHKTKRARGLLCASCNLRLGWYDRYAPAVRRYLRKRAP